MAYSELIKSFQRVRDYMREFYVYGFKSRDGYSKKSGRSYDNERRRIESWMGDYMRFSQDEQGKRVFLSIDSRAMTENPLYKAFKTSSFTDKDITLHFILFDILHSPEIAMSVPELCEGLNDYLVEFDEPMEFDESTVRKKLREYVSEGIIERRRTAERCSIAVRRTVRTSRRICCSISARYCPAAWSAHICSTSSHSQNASSTSNITTSSPHSTAMCCAISSLPCVSIGRSRCTTSAAVIPRSASMSSSR